MIIKNKTISSITKGSQVIDKIMKGTLTVYESWKNLIASGVPPLTLLNCKGVDLIDYKLYGNSYQETRSGKNLLKINQTTRTINGITFTVNEDTSITINGTATENATLPLNRNFTNNERTIPLKANTSYTLSKFSDQDVTDVLFQAFYVKNGVTSYATTTFTTVEETTMGAYIRISAGLTMNNVTISLQIEEGKENTFFEPYGEMPSPDYPSKIESVGEQTINLFDLVNVDFTGASIVVSKTIDKIVFDNSTSNLANYCSTPNILFDLKPNTTYSSRVKITEEIIQDGGYNSGTMNKSLLLQESTGWSTVERYHIVQGYQAPTTVKDDNGYYYTTFTTPEDMKNLKYITTRITGYSKLTFEDIMIVEGTYGKDNFPDYIPFGYEIPITVKGQNYFNPYWIGVGTKYGVTAEVDNDNIILNGWQDDRRYLADSVAYIEAGRYTFNTNIIGGELVNDLRLALYKSNEQGSNLGYYGTFATVNMSGKSDTQVLDIEAGYYMVVMLYKSSAEPRYTNTVVNIKMEKETPIKTNILLNEPLRKFGDYVDYIDFKNKKVVRNIGQVMYNANGGELWAVGTAYNGYFVGNTLLQDNALVLCNLAPSELENSTTIISIRKNYNAVRFQAIATLYDTLESFLQFLSNNNMQIIGKLVTPTEETIELPNIPTFKGTTVLEVDTTVQPSNLEVTYKGK